MPTLGPLVVPAVTTSGTFPLKLDYGWSQVHPPQIVVHTFDSGDRKIEQRFWLGDGATRYTVGSKDLTNRDVDNLKAFFDQVQGPYGQFFFQKPRGAFGQTTEQVACRFQDGGMTFDRLSDEIASIGITLVEVPTQVPSYTFTSITDRLPSNALVNQLAEQVQTLIPLCTITPRNGGDRIYLSDRSVNIGGSGLSAFFHPRLLKRSALTQGIDGEADTGTFTFGNADGLMYALANLVDLWRADVQFSAYHVESQSLIHLWRGDISNFQDNPDGTFTVEVSDGIYQLNLMYPVRRVTPTCPKLFDGPACPYSSHGSGGDPLACDKGYATPNGCTAHNMGPYFGGIQPLIQPVTVRDNSGGFLGYNRPKFTSYSIIANNIFDQTLAEVYTDVDMRVPAFIAEMRDEGDFFDAIGIVGEGPIQFSQTPSKHLLDGMIPHGPGMRGLGFSSGYDPTPDQFGLTSSNPAAGGSFDRRGSAHAAGTAFVEIRRKDASGLQLTQLSSHNIETTVSAGLTGWMWTQNEDGTFTRSGTELPNTNPVWVCANAYLKALGLRGADAATQAQYLDLDSIVPSAAECDLLAARLVGTGYERQFIFRGVINTEAPLRQWMQQILSNCLGSFTFRNKKLKIVLRVNASATQAFGPGNMLIDSLTATRLSPSFNYVTTKYGSVEADWALENCTIYDEDNGKLVGSPISPVYNKATLNLPGTSSRSQASRIVITRLREELGGINAAEWRKARNVQFNTTVLSLQTDPGTVLSITDPKRIPNGYGEYRCQKWALNEDWSITLSGKTVSDGMYDWVNGPRPAPVEYEAPPAGTGVTPSQIDFTPQTKGDGYFSVVDLRCGRNASYVRSARFDVYYIDETLNGQMRVFPQGVGAAPVALNHSRTNDYGSLTAPTLAPSVYVFDTELVGNSDWPLTNERVPASWYYLGGWANSPTTPVSAVHIYIDTQYVGPAHWGDVREDVVAAGHTGPDAPNLGYSLMFDMSRLQPGAHQWNAQVVFADGRVMRTPTVPFTVYDPPYKPQLIAGANSPVMRLDEVSYNGDHAVPGQFVYSQGEAMLVQNVSGDQMTVARAQLGTRPKVLQRVFANVVSVDTDCSFTVDDASLFQVGEAIYLMNGPAPSPADGVRRYIAAIEGNVIATQLPWNMSGISVVYSDPRLFSLKTLAYEEPVEYGFFRSAAATSWKLQKTLTNAGIVSVRGILQCADGTKSDPVWRGFWEYWPFRARTLGGYAYNFTNEQLAAGNSPDVFTALSSPETDAFGFAWMDISAPVSGYVGFISLGGQKQGSVHVHVGDLDIAPLGDLATTTAVSWIPGYDQMGLEGAARALTNWMNGGAPFTDDYVAVWDGSVGVRVYSKTGKSGAISATCTGQVTALCSGMSYQAGVGPDMSMLTPPKTGPVIGKGDLAVGGVIQFSVGPSEGSDQAQTAALPAGLSDSFQIAVGVGDGVNSHFITAQSWMYGENKAGMPNNNLADLIDSLVFWLNNDSEFHLVYRASRNDSRLFITDIFGNPGPVAVTLWLQQGTDGSGVWATPDAEGIPSPLGFSGLGRRYACTFFNSSNSAESALGPFSDWTGRSGSAQFIAVGPLPVSDTPGCDRVRIYAEEQIHPGKYYLLGTVPNGTQMYSDTLPMKDLIGQAQYPGEQQLSDIGRVVATAYLDDEPWFCCTVQNGHTRSKVLNGLALGVAPAGATFRVDMQAQTDGGTSRSIALEVK
jgi:hypothetical protein